MPAECVLADGYASRFPDRRSEGSVPDVRVGEVSDDASPELSVVERLNESTDATSTRIPCVAVFGDNGIQQVDVVLTWLGHGTIFTVQGSNRGDGY